MQTNMQTNTDHFMMTDLSHVRSCGQFRKNACRTRTLVDDFYLCQTNPANCEHAFPFGINYLCRSLERHEYSR